MARTIIPVEPTYHLQQKARRLAEASEATFSGEQVRALASPIVYAWTRGGQWLYVGMSKNGLWRCLDRRHPVAAIEPTDQLRVWPMPTVEDAMREEARLIRARRPLLNKAGKPTATGRIHPDMRDRCIVEYEGRHFGRRRGEA